MKYYSKCPICGSKFLKQKDRCNYAVIHGCENCRVYVCGWVDRDLKIALYKKYKKLFKSGKKIKRRKNPFNET